LESLRDAVPLSDVLSERDPFDVNVRLDSTDRDALVLRAALNVELRLESSDRDVLVVRDLLCVKLRLDSTDRDIVELSVNVALLDRSVAEMMPVVELLTLFSAVEVGTVPEVVFEDELEYDVLVLASCETLSDAPNDADDDRVKVCVYSQ
jgi:hypothetical protein